MGGARRIRQSWRRAEDGLVASIAGVDVADDDVRCSAFFQLQVGSLSSMLTSDPAVPGGRGTTAAGLGRSNRADSFHWLCRVAAIWESLVVPENEEAMLLQLGKLPIPLRRTCLL